MKKHIVNILNLLVLLLAVYVIGHECYRQGRADERMAATDFITNCIKESTSNADALLCVIDKY